MELADIGQPQHNLPLGHHPNCTKATQPPQSKASLDRDRDALRDNESIDMLYLTPEAYRAAEAIEFIAEHLRSEDEYIQVSVTYIPVLQSSSPPILHSLCSLSHSNAIVCILYSL